MHAFGAHLPLEKCKKPRTGRGFLRIDEREGKPSFFCDTGFRQPEKKDPFGSFFSLLFPAGELSIFHIQHQGAARRQVAPQDGFGNQRLGTALQIPLQRPGAIDGIIPPLNQQILGLCSHFQGQGLIDVYKRQILNSTADR